jgi:NTE family protein
MTVRVAIACQGGGSHTAFSAGVLKTILGATPAKKPFDIVALSGTSGGAICALLAWYGLIQDGRPVDGEVGDGEAGDGPTIDGRGEAAALLSAFWTREWPEGNATKSSREALREFGRRLEAGEPGMAATRLFDSLRNDLVQMVGPWMSNPAFGVNVELNPYFVSNLVELAAVRTGRPLDTLQSLWDAQRAIKELLTAYVDFEDVAASAKAAATSGFLPALHIGAVDVLGGNFKVFSSTADPVMWSTDGITAETVVASTALPTLMRAVTVGGAVYWDGLFSQNPPVHDLPDAHSARNPDRNPDEIWIIRINPRRRTEEPRDVAAIHDRRNELAGNLSLAHEIRSIRKINDLLRKGVIDGSRDDHGYKHVEIREIEISPALARKLEPLSKLDRKTEFIDKLMTDGERQATAALKEWGYV